MFNNLHLIVLYDKIKIPAQMTNLIQHMTNLK